MPVPEGPEEIEPTEQDPGARAQETAIGDIIGHVVEGTELKGTFTPEEQELLGRMTSKVAEVQKGHPPGTKINFDFSQNPEAYKVWSGMVNRLTEERLTTAEGKKSPLSEEEIKQLANEAGAFIRNYTREPSGPMDEGRYDWTELMIGRHDIRPEIGKRFQAHGLAKGSMGEQLKFLNTLLAEGIDPKRPFHTLPLRETDENEQAGGAMGAVGPYDSGSFIVISEIDKSMKEGIAGVLVNEHCYGAIPTLEKHFPGVKFIKAGEAPQAIEDWTKEKEKE